jgi:hypothetical protein
VGDSRVKGETRTRSEFIAGRVCARPAGQILYLNLNPTSQISDRYSNPCVKLPSLDEPHEEIGNIALIVKKYCWDLFSNVMN